MRVVVVVAVAGSVAVEPVVGAVAAETAIENYLVEDSAAPAAVVAAAELEVLHFS